MVFKKVSRVYDFLSKLYFINIGILVVAVFTGIYEYFSYANPPEGYDPYNDLLPVDILSIFVGLIQTIAVILLWVNFLKFIYRVSKNLQHQFHEKLIASPGWSVGYFFIPVLFLFKPFQVVKNILDVISKGEKYNKPLLGCWWAFWLISNFIARFLFRYSIDNWDAEVKPIESILYTISDSIDIITYILEYKVIKMIYGYYKNNYEEIIPSDNTDKDFSYINY